MNSELLLPNDLPGCQALIIELTKTVRVQEQKIASQNETIEEQMLEIAE